jgi:hypothetical protein
MRAPTFKIILLVCLCVAGYAADDPEVRPPVTQADLQIVERADKILSSEAVWNRADNRNLSSDATSFSLYTALEKATLEVTGKFAHREAVMQEARFAIDEVAPNRSNYHHRLMDYNNDPTTKFADIKRVLALTKDRIAKRIRWLFRQTY